MASSLIEELIQHIPNHRKLSVHFEEIARIDGVVLDLDFFDKKKKDRILPFIVTSEHVDSDGEIDNIESVAKLIPDMLKSERGVSITLLHTDTINGKVKHMELTTIGKVAEQYPKMKDRLNLEVNQDVKCIYGWAKMYTDTPVLDDTIWKLVQDGTLGGVSLRGVGKTKHNTKMCDVEGNCGKEVVGTKFWSITLSEDGQQAKPYSVVLTKLKKTKVDEIMTDDDCGGTVDEIKIKDSLIAEQNTQILDLKKKMTKPDKDPEDDKDKKKTDDDLEEPDEDDKKSKKKMTCPKCGESYGMEKMEKKEGHTLIRNDQLGKLLDDSEQLRKMNAEEQLSESEIRLKCHFGEKVKTKKSGSETLEEILASNPKIIKNMILENPEKFGFEKTRTPEGMAGGVKPEKTEPGTKDEKIPSLRQINDISMKKMRRNATGDEIIAIQIEGKTLEEMYN